ncbi:hypothetical protein PENTCL1PPCAC_7717, partial [Pristionchus entomophagus]
SIEHKDTLEMAGKEHRQCLICNVKIDECRLGIDSCRACAVFYRRIQSADYREPAECARGDGKCLEKGIVTSCRKCRFDRFSEVLEKAQKKNVEVMIIETVRDSESVQTASEPIKSRGSEEEIKDTSFIDHNTFMLMLHAPSSSSTPLLDKIRWSYSLMCQTLKSGETGTKSASFPLSQGDHDGSKIRFVPATYSMIIPNGRIFLSALHDLANMTFPDFAKLDSVKKGLCISECIAPVTLMDATYRARYHFPDDHNTHFASYTTIINEELFQSSLDACPFVTNKQGAIDALIENMKRTKSMSREVYQRVKPDNIEFTALLGLAFWNNDVGYINEELSAVVDKNRAEILKEMHEVYKVRGKTDYATRLGELFCLLETMKESPFCQ